MMIQVLDKGFIDVIHVAGDDKTAVDAARISYKHTDNLEDRILSYDDEKILTSLLKNKHLSPFEHSQMMFHVKSPIFVARQIFRHRTFSYSEASLRYTSKEIDFYVPELSNIKSKVNPENDLNSIKKVYDIIYNEYEKMLNHGVQKELARTILPLGLYTEFYMTCDLRNLMHFLNLRADSHAQPETQQYAKAIAKCFKQFFPYTFEKFIEYSYEGDLLSIDI